MRNEFTAVVERDGRWFIAYCPEPISGTERPQVEVSRLAAAAWTAWAHGRHEEALSLMRRAADLEDKAEKHIVTPGRILPARELLGDMLLELKRPAEALQQFEASQRREPDRFRGLYGAAQAAAQSGDIAKATRYFSRLVEIAGQGDPRPAVEFHPGAPAAQ